MRQYLDSPVLRNKVLHFWQKGKQIGALCHGVLVLARTIDSQTEHSILYGHKVTATLKSLDRLAYRLDSWLVRHGYIMYSKCVADEVRASLSDPRDFLPGSSIFKTYVVSDGTLITSRWYLDAELFAECFVKVLQQRMDATSDTMKL